MNEGSMSIGGPGGLKPGKIEKDLSELGQAKEADVTKLQSGLKSNQTASTSSTADTGTATKPFDIQATRITDAHIAAERHLGKSLIEYAQKLQAVNINQTKDMMKKLKEIHTKGNKGITQVDAIELQVLGSEMLIFADAVSKGVGKIVTGLQTIIKQQ